MKWELRPITLRAARGFTDMHHRHNMGAKGHKFSIGLFEGDTMIGTVTVGRPVSRMLDNGTTAEVTRCCVREDMRNANSCLYGAAVRAAKAMGYRRIITYTLPEESGCSLKAAGFRPDGKVRGRDWNCPSRPRHTLEQEKYPRGDKLRWIHD